MAGDAEFSTTHASLSVSYIKTMGNKFARNYLSVGFSGGMVQRSVDYNQMTFGSQFNGYEYDPGLFSGEYIGFENLSYFDLAGVSLMLVPKDQLNFIWALPSITQLTGSKFYRSYQRQSVYEDHRETWVHRYRLALPGMHFWCPLSWP